ncbi:VWA domain-containing protein [Sorangium sp. So ce1036]|uniref:vWA domain-containing protein n=1 Tax=Sorangium sp. So ce1036 TaxID=3133328 RepID=UPI003F0FF94C
MGELGTVWSKRALLGGALALGLSVAGLACDRALEGAAAPAPPLVSMPAQASAASEARREGPRPLDAEAQALPAPRAGAAPAARAGGVTASKGLSDLGRGRAPGQVAAPPAATASREGAMWGGPAAAAPVEAAIDPNGRFATTYRPGGGHLAAFESAVARGIIPPAERELVSDVGARYAPALDAPKGATLALRTDLERARVPPGGGPVHVRVALRSTAQAPAARPHLSVHLVLDVSGSMQGEPIARAREAARALVDRLDAGDDFSLITFSSDAQVLIPDGPVGARRAMIKAAIDGIAAAGGTNIGRGLELGYAEASRPGIPEGAVKVVLLLSDGRANAGITRSERLSRLALDAFQGGVQTSTFGLGADYDGALMSAVAGDGAGGYYYLRDPDQIAPALATELDRRLDPVATAVELRVRLRPDVELLHVYGSRRLSEAEAARARAIEVAADAQAEARDRIARDRRDDAEGGMRFLIPAFARDDSHALLLELGLPAGVEARTVASIELKYKDRVARKNVVEETPLRVAYAAGDADSAASADPSVARTIQGFAAGETLAEAARQIAIGDRARAAALLSEREGILRAAAGALDEPLFLTDADRLARLRGHTGAAGGLGDPLVLAMLLETASRAHLR